MSGWEMPASSDAPVNQDWNAGGAAEWNDGAPNNMASGNEDGFGAAVNGNFAGEVAGEGDLAGANDRSCRNCGHEGHMARECPEPRKMGACFNCGEEGHSKNECPNPRVFKGECRNCGQEGHMANDCPTRVVKCKNCQQEGHAAMECTNPKVVDNARVADKSENEAWDLLKQASDERDICDFKEAVQILSKAAPDYTYPFLEKEFRKRGFNVYLIAMEKDHGDTWTNVNLQGDIGKKFAISYFTSDKPQRPALLEKWPRTPEENLARLADAGIPLDRGVDKCNNCNKLGHTTKRCPDERMASAQPVVTCFLCGEEGHRVRDCGQERKRGGRACKICESEEHIAKDCPNKEKQACRVCGDEEHLAKDCPSKEKRTCRNCGEEDHMARDCPNPRKITCNICSEEGHMARECPKKDEAGPRPPRDWSKVTCSICNEKGHGRARCPQARSKEIAGESGLEGTGGGGGGGGDVGAGWDAPANTGSAPAEWETAQTSDAFGGATASAW